MRAIFVSNDEIEVGQKVTLDNDQAHHLINVVRAKIKDKVLLLNGKGLKINGLIKTINRKEVIVEVVSFQRQERPELFDVAAALLKRESMIESLRSCVELGVSTIFPIKTDFSQKDFIKQTRIDRIFESACIQSNATCLPHLKEVQDFSPSLFGDYDLVIVFSSHPKYQKPLREKVVGNERVLLVLGPEGGFSEDELSVISGIDKCFIVHFPTNILRATTALPAACGWFLGKIYNEVESR